MPPTFSVYYIPRVLVTDTILPCYFRTIYFSGGKVSNFDYI